MVKKAAVLLGVIFTLASSGTIYPATMEVIEVDELCDVVVFETATGDYYRIEGVEDWCAGDFASLIMYDNCTPAIEDDVIVTARYSGYHVYG